MPRKNAPPDELTLSRRERQIMDLLYARGDATVGQIHEALPHPPAPTAVRTMLAILESRGHVKRRQSERGYLYSPTTARQRAGQSALQRVLSTFFDGSLDKAVAAHLANKAVKVEDDDLRRVADAIRRARQEGR